MTETIEAKPKKRKNGRAKGKTGEREVAKLCATWWARIEPGCEFRSTPSSGGWATPQLRGHFKVAGDLTTTAKLWPFTVEVKRREKGDMLNVYRAKPSPIWGWWEQACKAAAEEGRVPILFFRKNSKHPEWFVMVPDIQELHLLLPRLDTWGFSKRPPATVPPLLTTWDVLERAAPKAIIRACPAYVSPQALAARQASPKPKLASSPKIPPKTRQRPAQAGASLPPVTEEEKLRRIGEALAGFGPRSPQNSDQEPEPPPSPKELRAKRARAGASSALDQHPDPEFRTNAMMRELALLPKQYVASQQKRSATEKAAWRRIKLDAEKALRRQRAQERRDRAKDPALALAYLRQRSATGSRKSKS